MRFAVLCLAVLVAPVSAQLPKGEFPAGYEVRTDQESATAEEIVFVEMRPGWHITTGPAAILYDPALRAEGSYRVDAEAFLFDPGERREAFGVFIGGRDLDGDAQAYTYFLIRHTGEFLVKRRRGDDVTTIQDWTAHPSIVTWANRGSGATAKNVFAIDVGPETVRFMVNDAEVASLARDRVDTDGVVGLRVNHELNLHVSSLVVTKF